MAKPMPMPLDPRPDPDKREQCPECLMWLKSRVDGVVRMHGGCPGGGTEDTRGFRLEVTGSGAPVRMRLTGRRSVEIVGDTYRRKGATVTVYREN